MNNSSDSIWLTKQMKTSIILFIVGVIAITLAFIIGIADNPPGIILVMLGFFTVIFALLSPFGKSKNSGLLMKLLYWSPRTLCIVTILFLSVFALDVFNEHKSFWTIFLDLNMHLIPTYIMILVLVFSWKWEWIGGFLFVLLGLFYIIAFRGRFPIVTYFLVAGPLILTGGLFLLNWKFKSKFVIESEI